MKLESLQVVRAIAALAVLQAHLDHFFGFGGNQFGGAGVDLFFVLSGYIVTRSAAHDPCDFLQHRAIRVLPPWYVAVFPWLVGAVIFGQANWRSFLSTVFLWPATDVFQMPYLSVGWSLCYEMVFYVSVWLVLQRVWPMAILAVYAACCALSATGQPVFIFLGSPMIVEFLFGVAIALYAPSDRRLGLAALTLAGVIAAFFIVTGDHGLYRPIIGGESLAWTRVATWGVGAALAIYGAAQFPRTPRWARPIIFLGDASYALYVTHLTVILALATNGVRLPAVIVGGICLAVAISFYLVVERPLLALLRTRRILGNGVRGAVSGAPSSSR